ncbi:cupin domain-containing protein [Shinella sp. 838]|uniref:cupin domain-containing protein n=1 Tax=Shinella sp. 838 TaxID=3038164 RepID=UPI0024151250|nr:cupin domain-containing protein [Shinella sp. 838]MDG4674938.1 cupin domain-containing protein [Shinella sp. 838]
MITDNGGALSVATAAADRLTPADGLNLDYSSIAELAGQGITIARGHVAAGASVPPHAAPTTYALFVLRGAGILTLHAADDAQTAEIAFKPGDLIVFPPNAKHGWVNGDDAFEWFGVDIAPRG